MFMDILGTRVAVFFLLLFVCFVSCFFELEFRRQGDKSEEQDRAFCLQMHFTHWTIQYTVQGTII